MTTSKAYARMRRGAASGTGNSAPRANSPRTLLVLLAATLLVWASLAGISGCGGAGSSITIQITPGITQNVDQGQSLNFTATLANDTTNAGVTWTLTGSGCSGSGCGTLSGNTTSFVTYTAPTGQGSQLTATLTATSNAASGVTKTVTINVVLPPTFTTTSLPNGANGIPYSQAIVVTGGVAPLSFTIGSGSIPPGLNLDLAGTLLGTPSCPGSVPTPACPANASNSYSFVVKVTDSGNPPLSVPSNLFTVIISPPPPLAITSSGALPSAQVNAIYPPFQIQTSGGVPPFTWSILSGSLPTGLTLNTTSGLITGTPNPLTVGTQFKFTPQVHDFSIPRQIVSTPAPLSILVTQPQPLAIATESPLMPGTVATPYASFITATGGIPPYRFGISPGLLPSGLTLNASSGEITGSPILVINSTFTASVKDSGIVPSTATAQLSLNITQGTSNPDTLFASSYAFLFTGFDADGTVLMSGNFTTNSSGMITGGSEDIVRKSGITQAATVSGTYSIGTDGRGSFQLTVMNSVGQTVTDVFQFVLESDGSASFFANDKALNWADAPTRGSGILKRQVGGSFAPANFSGNYGFGFSGQDSGGKPAALAGFVHADGIQTFSPGTIDYNDAGAYSPAVPLSGNFGLASTGGRGTASLIFQPPTTAQFTLNYAFYMVSSNDLFFVAIDPTDATHPRLGGEMILQNPNTVLNNSALNGVSVATGTGLSINASVLAGFLTGDGNGNASVSYNENNGGTISTPSFASAYRVLTSGRVNLTSGLGPRIAALYLTGQGQGFLIGSDTAATSGILEQQIGNLPFSPSSFNGGFTLGAPFTADNLVADILGQLTADGISTSQGVVDAFPASGSPALNQKFGGAFTLGANGKGQMTTNTPIGIPTNLVLFMVSPESVRAISTDTNDANPEVIFLDH